MVSVILLCSQSHIENSDDKLGLKARRVEVGWSPAMNMDSAQNSEETALVGAQIAPVMQLRKPEVDSTMEFISSMQAAGSTAQALAIISAMVLAITFAGASYREQSQDIMATKRFASEIILANSSAFSCAMISLFMGVAVIIRSQSIVSPLYTKIAVKNDPSGQGNDFNNNTITNDQNPGSLREEIMLRKWYVIVSSLLILFSTVLLVIGEVLDLVAISCGPPDSLGEVWFVLIMYPINTVLGVAFLLWITRCIAKKKPASV